MGRPKKIIKEEIEIEEETINPNVCIYCGLPATITSNDGNRYCSLACQCADGN